MLGPFLLGGTRLTGEGSGNSGAPGRGVTHTAVVNGNLLVTYSDGTSENAGHVLGEDGTDGAPGVGIAAIEVVAGSLRVTLSDGTSRDLGSIVGPKGSDGAVGAAGRGISSSVITGGHLILTYTDGSTLDLGQVNGATGAAGADGRGIASSAIVNGRLVLTYTDGATQDLGNVVGPAGDVGSATYTAPFTGAVQRTIRSKFADTIDARDLGVVADGVTDCSVAMQAVLDLAKAGPVHITLPPGTIRAAGLTFYSYTELVGAGRQRTIIKAPNGANKDILKSKDADGLFGTNNPGGVHHFTFSGFSIDGNYENQTSGRGIVIYGYAFNIGDVEVRKCYSHGIQSEWWDSNAYTDDNSNELMESFLDRVVVQHCRGDGIYWNGPHDSHMNDVVLASNNHLRVGVARGLYVGPKGAGLRGVNVHSWSFFQEYAIVVAGVNVSFLHSSVDGFYTGGLHVLADGCKFQGTVLQYVNSAAPPYTTCKGVILGPSVRDYDIDVMSFDMKAAHVDFGTSGPGKLRVIGRINASALQSGSVGYVGTPNQQADIDLITNSATFTVLVSRPSGMNIAGIWNYQNQVSSWSFGAGFATRTQVNGVDVETWDVFQKTYAPLRFSVAGDAKHRTLALKTINPGASVYGITADGLGPSAANQLVLTDKASCFFRAVIVAHRTDADGDTASYVIEGHAKRGSGAGSVVLSGVVVTTRYASDSTWAVGAVADATYGGVRFTFSGAAGKTVRVFATVTTTEVSL